MEGPRHQNGPWHVKRIDFDVGGIVWKGPGLKTGPWMFKGTISAYAGQARKGQASKLVSGCFKERC